jgi:hypothetical protein
MESLFASGRIVDLILLAMLLEGALLLALRRRVAPRLDPWGLLAFLLAGAALMLALRVALTGAHWGAIAPWLLLALVAHLADLLLRARDRR